jgi:hypothetical protein
MYSFSPSPDQFDPFSFDTYTTDINESLMADEEWDSDPAQLFSSTPPIRIPSFNSDNVSSRRLSMSDRLSYSNSHQEESFIFSPFCFEERKMTGDDFVGFELEKIGYDKDYTGWFEEIYGYEIKGNKDMMKKSLKTFIRTAIKLGRIIIAEAHLPIEEKSITPSLDLGIAGGEKYIYAGIFIKFAIDERGIYGGDTFAAKAAGHELKGYDSIREAHIDKLLTPYIALIDYRGFRLIATTYIPTLTGNSLKYGSQDGGKNVHDEDSNLRELIKTLCIKLNLKKHTVSQGVDIYGPVDLEGHVGPNDNYYLLDTARLFPPFPPSITFLAFPIHEFIDPEELIRPIPVPYENWESSIINLVDGYVSNEKLIKKEFSSGVLFHGYPGDFLC